MSDSEDDDMEQEGGAGEGHNTGDENESHDEDASSRFGGQHHNLPFKPQKLLKVNRYVPFSNTLDDEALKWFIEIKENFARSLAFYEWRPGVMIWASRLEAYISLHGMKFSKQDHLAMIKLVFEVVTTTEKMEPSVLMRLVGVLSLLTHRIELLSPDDLQLPWRPLYDVYERYEMNNHDDAVGLEFMPEAFGTVLAGCIHHCRVYFPLAATQEMLDEWRPKMCPYSDSIEQAITYFEMFLPTVIRNKEQNMATTCGLWFEEFMTWWLSIQHIAPWESTLITLLSRLAIDTIGYIDWRPYISQICDRYLYCINLPTGRLSTRPRIGNQTFDAISGPVWITSMLHFDECIDALAKVINATETYFYPSNSGSWAPALCQAILTIPSTIVARLVVERHSKKSSTVWRPSPPAHAHLRDDQILRIVQIYKPLALIAIYRRSAIERMSVFPCLASLIQLQPKLMVQEIVDNFYGSIDALEEPGRFLSALNALNFCVKEMVRLPETRKNVLPILEALLPAMDVNDFRKTIASMNVIYNLLLLINLHDCSSQASAESSSSQQSLPSTPTSAVSSPPLTDDERELCLATAGFEEISLLILDRCLSYLENCSMDTHLISETVSKDEVISMNYEEMPVRGLMVNTILTLALVSTDTTVRSLCKRISMFIMGTIFDARHFSGGTLCTICHHLARLKPDAVSQSVLGGGGAGGLVQRVLMRLQEMRDVLPTKTHMDAETCWLMAILVDFVCGHPRLVMEFLEPIKDILTLALSARCRRIARSGGALLGGTLRALTDIQLDTAAAFQPARNDPVTIREWGKQYHIEELSIRWEKPTADTIAAAQELIDLFVAPLLGRLSGHADASHALSRIELEQTLYSVERAVAGASMYSHFGPMGEKSKSKSKSSSDFESFQHDEQPVKMPFESAVEIHSKYATPSAYPNELEQRPEQQGFTIRCRFKEGEKLLQFRRAVFGVLKRLQERLLASDDNKSMQELVRIYKSLLFDRGRTIEEVVAKRRNQAVLRPFIVNQSADRRLQPKIWHLGRIVGQYEKRLVERRMLEFTHFRREVADNLLRLSVSRYRGVRQLAQSVFSEVAANFKFTYLLYVEDIVGLLDSAHAKDDDESQLKGALHLLVDAKSRCWLLKHHWPSIRRIWPALVRAQSRHSDRPLFANLLLLVGDVMERAYTTTAIFERELPHVVDRAREWLGVQWTTAGGAAKTKDDLDDAAAPMLQSPTLSTTTTTSASTITEAELAVVYERSRKQEGENIECYNAVVRELAMLIASKHLQNSNQLFAEFLLTMLPRADVPFPIEGTDVLLDAFINPSSYRSRQTITLALFALLRKTKPHLKRMSVRQYVRQYRKIPVDELDNTTGQRRPPVLGVRSDNEWLCFNEDDLPTMSAEKFDATFFIDKEWIGYNGWPAEHYTIAAPLSEQNHQHLLAPPRDDAAAIAIYQKFVGSTDDDRRYLDRVVQLLSLEDNEYHSRFNPNNANLWIFLCRNFGIVIMRKLLPYIDTLLDGRLDHQQRCAAEMLCGIICGAKRWPYVMIKEMHAELGKRIEKALQFITVETQTDWGEFAINCFTMGDNARRHYPLYRLLLTIRSAAANAANAAAAPTALLLDGTMKNGDMIANIVAPTSFNIATRIYLAQCTFFAAHDWRRKQLHYKLLETLKPHFDQPYRDRVGSALASIFSLNNGLPYLNTADKDQGPKLKDFMEEYLPVCLSLLNTAPGGNRSGPAADEERRNMLIFECIVRMTISHIDENRMHPLEANQFELFPLLCRYESDAKDDRLRTSCRIALALLAGHLIPDRMFDLVLKHAELVADSTTNDETEVVTAGKKLTAMPWRGRVVALHCLQALIFNNLMLIHSRPDAIRALRELVTRRLCDAQIEVREAASELLTGLFRCGIMPIDAQTVQVFKNLASIRVLKRVTGVRRVGATSAAATAAAPSGDADGQQQQQAVAVKAAKKLAENQNHQPLPLPPDNVIKRHAGVLGLCACVLSHPYSVPEFMPDILMALRDHLHDPPPMQTTTRKALYEFKRTHASQWQEHKKKFNDDQLAMLTDLLVSPNYYA